MSWKACHLPVWMCKIDWIDWSVGVRLLYNIDRRTPHVTDCKSTHCDGATNYLYARHPKHSTDFYKTYLQPSSITLPYHLQIFLISVVRLRLLILAHSDGIHMVFHL